MGRDLKAIFSTTENTSIPILGPLLDQLPQSKIKYHPVVELTLDLNMDIPSDEGYRLKVSSKGVRIWAKSDAGLFYACQTLEQLLEDSRDLNERIPAMEILDYPVIAYRSIQIDVKNHLDRTEYYYRMIDKLAKYKINGII